MSILLSEFDPSPALIEPAAGRFLAKEIPCPKTAVSTFPLELFEEMIRLPGAVLIHELRNAGRKLPVYAVPYKDTTLAVYPTPVGAPAAVGTLEEIYAMGVQSVLVFGSCGVLDRQIADGGIILPTAALRDEGTSFHYAPPAEEIPLEPEGTALLEQLAKELSLPCFKGKTWTTDAFYRETPDKIARRKAKGAIAVEMECAALTACAAFRKKHFAQFLFAADNLDAPAWDQRGLALQGTHIRDQLLELAFEAALRMDRLF